MAWWEYQDKDQRNQEEANRFQSQAQARLQSLGTGTGNFLNTALDILGRPRNVVQGAAYGIETGHDPLETAMQGFLGQRQYSGGQLITTGYERATGQPFPDVLRRPVAGIPEGIPLVSGLTTPLTMGGLGLDVGMDPNTYIPYGGIVGKGAELALGAERAGQVASAIRGAATEAPVLGGVVQAATRPTAGGFAGVLNPELGTSLSRLNIQQQTARATAEAAMSPLTRELGGKEGYEELRNLVERPNITIAGGERPAILSAVDEAGNVRNPGDVTVGELYRGRRGVSPVDDVADAFGRYTGEHLKPDEISGMKANDFADTVTASQLKWERRAQEVEDMFKGQLKAPTEESGIPIVRGESLPSRKAAAVPDELAETLNRFSKAQEGIEEFASHPYTAEELAKRASYMDVLRKHNAVLDMAGVNYGEFPNYYPGFVETRPSVAVRPGVTRTFATSAEREAAGYAVKPAYEALLERLTKGYADTAKRDFLNRLLSGAATLDEEGKMLPGRFTDPRDNPLVVLATRGQEVPEGLRPLDAVLPEHLFFDKETGLMKALGKDVEGATAVVAEKPTMFLADSIFPDVARYFRSFSGTGGMEPILSALGKAQFAWKFLQTGLYPAKFVRNFTQDLYNGFYLSGMNPVEAATAMKRGIDFARGAPDAAVQDLIRGTAVSSAGGLKNVPIESAQDFVTEMTRQGVLHGGEYGRDLPSLVSMFQDPGTVVKGYTGKLVQLSYKLGDVLEDPVRLGHLFWRLEKGDSLEQAVQSVKKYLFSYYDLGPAERTFGRALFPFYSWFRLNLPLQIQAMVTEPKYMAMLDKVRTEANPDAKVTPDEMNLLGDYLDTRFGIMMGHDKVGNLKVLAGTGLPVEDLNLLWSGTPQRTLRNILSSASPLLDTPFEYALGMDNFSGKQIDDENVQNFYRTVYPYLANVPGLRNWLEIEPHTYATKEGDQRTVYTANPMKMFFFTKLVGRAYTTVGKVTDVRKDFPDRMANFLTGMKIYSIDMARQGAEWTTQMQQVRDDTNQHLDTVAQAFQSGQIDGNQWRAERARALTEKNLKIEGIKMALSQDQAVNDARKKAIANLFLNDDQRAAEEYYAITPQMFLGPGGIPDMRRFFQARQEYLGSLGPDQQATIQGQRDAFLKNLPPAAQGTEREYQRALELYKFYRSVAPQFRGVPGDSDQENQMNLAMQQRAAYRRTYGPAGDSYMHQIDPQALQMGRWASHLRNPQRTFIWQQINRENGGLLAKYFSDISPAAIDLVFGQEAAA